MAPIQDSWTIRADSHFQWPARGTGHSHANPHKQHTRTPGGVSKAPPGQSLETKPAHVEEKGGGLGLQPYLLSPLGGQQLAERFCQASDRASPSPAMVLRSSEISAPPICPVPALPSQNLKAATLSEKARNTAVSPFPLGEVRLSLLAPDVKAQLGEWRDATWQLSQVWEDGKASRAETSRQQGYQDYKSLAQGERGWRAKAFHHSTPWPSDCSPALPSPQTPPVPCPSQFWLPGPLAGLFVNSTL